MEPIDRKQLGAFLKSRRARLNPADVGLPPSTRRRAPGLRREEVATLAGVSVTWYTWIEQGRDITVSHAVLESLARTLHLTPQERNYLFTLATPRLMHPEQIEHEHVSAALQHILDHQHPYPAYLMGHYWNILAWNQAACALFGDFALLPIPERNMLWYTFVHPAARQRVVDWPVRARRLLAEFRAECGPALHEPAIAQLVASVQTASPEFARWWHEHDVVTRDGGLREFQHPHDGRLALIQTTMRLSNQPGIKLVLHIPASAALQAIQRDSVHNG